MTPRFSADYRDPWWRLPHEEREEIMLWLERVGAGDRFRIRAVELGEGYVTVERYLLDETGHLYVDDSRGVAATETVTVRVEEPPPEVWR